MKIDRIEGIFQKNQRSFFFINDFQNLFADQNRKAVEWACRESYVNAFVVVLFGTFLFPMTKTSFDAIIVNVAYQAVGGSCYTVALIVETIRSLASSKCHWS